MNKLPIAASLLLALALSACGAAPGGLSTRTVTPTSGLRAQDAPAPAPVPDAGADHPARYFSSIVWCVMENHGVDAVGSLPSEAFLVKNGATFAQYDGVTHPSGPNYRVMTSGRRWSVFEEYKHKVPTVASELSTIGIPTVDWYVRGTPDLRHDPYVELQSPVTIRKNEAFDPDSLPATAQVYLGYDDEDNAHSGPLATVDTNLSELVSRLDHSKWFNTPDAHGLYPVLMVTWDESYTPDNNVLTTFYGRGVKAGYVSHTPTNHYNLCRTLTDNWNLQPLADAAKVPAITDIWKPAAAPAPTTAGL